MKRKLVITLVVALLVLLFSAASLSFGKFGVKLSFFELKTSEKYAKNCFPFPPGSFPPIPIGWPLVFADSPVSLVDSTSFFPPCHYREIFNPLALALDLGFFIGLGFVVYKMTSRSRMIWRRRN